MQVANSLGGNGNRGKKGEVTRFLVEKGKNSRSRCKRVSPVSIKFTFRFTLGKNIVELFHSSANTFTGGFFFGGGVVYIPNSFQPPLEPFRRRTHENYMPTSPKKYNNND